VRDVYVPSLGRYVPAEVYDGEAITPGFSAPGPLVVEEPHTSVVVFPGQVLSARTSYMYAIETLA
jgi:N-methylhydantoinase A